MLLSASCSSDSDSDMEAMPEPKVTYTNTISRIVSSNCTSCHGSTPRNGALMSLTSYSDVKNSVLNRGLIARIENGTMPPSGNLSISQIQSFKTWQANGFLE